MNRPTPKPKWNTSTTRPPDATRRHAVYWWIAASLGWATLHWITIALWQPTSSNQDAAEGLHRTPSGALLTLAECLCFEGIVLAFLLAYETLFKKRFDRVIPAWFLIAPACFGLDSIAFHLSGRRMLSSEFLELVATLPVGIVRFSSLGVFVPILCLAAYLLVWTWIAFRLESFLDHHTVWHAWSFKRLPVAIVIVSLVGTAILLGDRKHPANSAPSASNRERRLTRIDQRISQMRMNVIVADQSATDEPSQPDVLIIIAESLRPETVSRDVMPNVFALSQNGLHLRQHYSGGNSSSLGVFSIVSGLEAVWFYKSDVRFAPAMNRLFRQAGYELGFFASTNDWATFQMDAFLSDRHYDVMQDEPFSGLDADARAIASAKQFLHFDSDTDPKRPPRLAVVCLYATHTPFCSDKRFESDQPAAGKNYPIPFPPILKDRVYNRYRNAARTLDASIEPLLKIAANDRPRVVLVTGDHGESFGEDGTIGHGLRLSKAQVETPAIIAGPGIHQDTITHPTSHADLLPTLLSACRLDTSMPELFDGIDLTRTGSQSKKPPSNEQRLISIASYSGKAMVLVGSETSADGELVESPADGWLGLRCRCSFTDEEASPLHWVDQRGLPSHSRTSLGDPNAILTKWLSRMGVE